jgi:hypothetical protein
MGIKVPLVVVYLSTRDQVRSQLDNPQAGQLRLSAEGAHEMAKDDGYRKIDRDTFSA